MNKSKLFKTAHSIAKATKAYVGDYMIALSLALKDLYQGAVKINQSNQKGETMYSDDNSKKNLSLWEAYKTTDSDMVRFSEKDKRQIKTAPPQHRKMLATKAFGPYGLGWGIDADSEVFERIEIQGTYLLHYQAKMFYTLNDKKSVFKIHSSVKEAYTTQKGYLKVDDEAMKKVVTDALTKGLSNLGFCADLYSDSEMDYEAQEAIQANKDFEKKQKELEAAEAEKKKKERLVTEYNESKQQGLEEMGKAKTKSSIETLKTALIRKAQIMGDDAFIKQIDGKASARLAQLAAQAKAEKEAKAKAKAEKEAKAKAEKEAKAKAKAEKEAKEAELEAKELKVISPEQSDMLSEVSDSDDAVRMIIEQRLRDIPLFIDDAKSDGEKLLSVLDRLTVVDTVPTIGLLHPDMTVEDLEHVILIVMNLSINELMSLSGLTQGEVMNCRFRIKASIRDVIKGKDSAANRGAK